MKKWFCLLILSAGVAAAEAAPNLPSEPLGPRLSTAVRDLTNAELEQVAGELTKPVTGWRSTPLAKALPKAGKFIRYGGTALITIDLIKNSMDWFYKEVQRESNSPDLNNFWGNPFQGAFSLDTPLGKLSFQQQCYARPGFKTASGYDGYAIGGGRLYDDPRASSIGGTAYLDSTGWHRANLYRLDQEPNGPANASKAYGYECSAVPAKQLQDIFKQDPSAPDEVKQIVTDYLESHPNLLPTILTPMPNQNQIDDAPSDKTIDTDGDGVPDWDEMQDKNGDGKPDGDPNDSTVIPGTTVSDPVTTVPASTVTTTVRNPDGSTTRRTVTIRPDGTKRVVEITTRTDKSSNPDGSTTTKTTTTTTTTEYNSDGSQKGDPVVTTKTDEETSLPEEPTPTEEEPCKVKGGTWDSQGSTCSMPDKKDELPLQDEFTKPDTFKLPDLSKLKENWNKNADALKSEVADKFPFGIKDKWFPAPGQVGSECPAYPVHIGVIEGEFKPCDTQVARDAHSLMRPLLVGILLILTGFAAARIAGQA